MLVSSTATVLPDLSNRSTTLAIELDAAPDKRGAGLDEDLEVTVAPQVSDGFDEGLDRAVRPEEQAAAKIDVAKPGQDEAELRRQPLDCQA